MKRVIILGIIMVFWATSVFSQNNNLIEKQVRKPLRPENQKFLDKITSEATTKQYEIIGLNLEALKNSFIVFELFNDHIIKVKKQEVKQNTNGMYTWIGNPQNNFGKVIIVVNGEDVAGSIVIENKIYEIRSLGNSIYVLIEIDQSKFPPEKCHLIGGAQQKSFKNQQEGMKTTGQSGLGLSAKTASFSCNLRLLVAYTPFAKSQVTNILTLIQLAVEETNQSYNNSNINHQVELAHAVEVNYSESDFNTDLDRFAGKSDGYMDNIHQLRDLYSADVCVLVVNNSAYCGLAKKIYAEHPDDAFCEVHYNCLTGYYSFAHEIGHLQGARHDTYVDNNTDPFEYGHGYVNISEKWRTIMAYNNECAVNGVSCTRIPYWSNPNINHPTTGSAMGTSSDENNARVLNETTGRMKNYRVPSENLYLSNTTINNMEYADIIAIDTIEAGNNYVIKAEAEVHMRASTIVLKPGFEAKYGSNVIIEPATITQCCTNNITPIVKNESTIGFVRCSGGSSQLCIGFNCANNYSVTIYNIWGQEVYSGSGPVDDNIACIWDGSGVSNGIYFAVISVSNGSQTIEYNYSITVLTANCKETSSSDVVIIQEQDTTTLAKKEFDKKEILERIEKEYTVLVYPNPATNLVTFEYGLPVTGRVSLFVTNAFGQKVKVLVDNENQDKGKYKISFNVSDLSPGIYYYTLQAGDFKKTKKIILIK